MAVRAWSRVRSSRNTARAIAVWIMTGGSRPREAPSKQRRADDVPESTDGAPLLATESEEVLDELEARARQHRLGMELDAPRFVLLVLQSHDLAFGRPRHDLEHFGK